MGVTTFPNGVDSTVIRDGVKKTAAYTVVINNGDSGKTFYIETGAVTFTLPAIATGNTYTFVNMNPDGTAALTISPNANDGIAYAGAVDDNKDLINTAATAKKGDFVTLFSGDGVVMWQVSAASGVWAKEA
jgi:hypothetical protein